MWSTVERKRKKCCFLVSTINGSQSFYPFSLREEDPHNGWTGEKGELTYDLWNKKARDISYVPQISCWIKPMERLLQEFLRETPNCSMVSVSTLQELSLPSRFQGFVWEKREFPVPHVPKRVYGRDISDCQVKNGWISIPLTLVLAWSLVSLRFFHLLFQPWDYS